MKALATTLVTLLAVSSSVAAFAREPKAFTPLFECQIEGERFALDEQSEDRHYFRNKLVTPIHAEKRKFEGTLQYAFDLAEGLFLMINFDDDGKRSIFASAYGGPCDEGTAKYDVEMLEALLKRHSERALAVPFLKCENGSDRGHIYFTIRKGNTPRTAIVESIPETIRGGSMEVSFVASALQVNSAPGSMRYTVRGRGAVTHFAAGAHAYEKESFQVSTSSITGTSRVTFGDEHLDSVLGICTVTNFELLDALVSSESESVTFESRPNFEILDSSCRAHVPVTQSAIYNRNALRVRGTISREQLSHDVVFLDSQEESVSWGARLLEQANTCRASHRPDLALAAVLENGEATFRLDVEELNSLYFSNEAKAEITYQNISGGNPVYGYVISKK